MIVQKSQFLFHIFWNILVQKHLRIRQFGSSNSSFNLLNENKRDRF